MTSKERKKGSATRNVWGGFPRLTEEQKRRSARFGNSVAKAAVNGLNALASR